jgi:membrane fusion protein (multidrug efflux system)
VPSEFSRTLRSLAADGFASTRLTLALVVLLGVLWCAWLAFSEVTLYAVADQARLEVNRSARPVEAVVGGRVITSRLVLGQDVAEGQVLVELDAAEPRLELEAERARERGLSTELEALRGVIAAEEQTSCRELETAVAGLEEAKAREREADGVAKFAEEEAKRFSRLQSDGSVAELELLRSRSEAQKLRSAADALHLNIVRLEHDQERQSSERGARIAELKRDVAALEGSIATSNATMDLITQRMVDRVIRAPISGRLGEVSELSAGAVVVAGEKLGAVIPSGDLLVIAQYDPAAAIGRIRAGQEARVRLDAFPWAQYGSLRARVRNVASEVREGKVRVELDLESDLGERVRLEHGLTGTVEVIVEHISPLRLILRSLGELLRGRSRSEL